MKEGDVIEARAGHVAVARAGDEDRRVEVTPLVAVAWGRASGTAAVVKGGYLGYWGTLGSYVLYPSLFPQLGQQNLIGKTVAIKV
jgi:hypothetical protein